MKAFRAGAGIMIHQRILLLLLLLPFLLLLPLLGWFRQTPPHL